MSPWVRRLGVLCALLATLANAACSRRAPLAVRATLGASTPSALPVPSEPAALSSAALPLHGDAARGKALVQRFECNRCHEGTGFAAAPLTKNCFSCHEQIITGRFPVSPAALARFRPHVESAREAPSLTAIGGRLEGAWLRDYLLAPHDLRPKLTPTMPRLALDAEQASDIATYLTVGTAHEAQPAPQGNADRGRELMDQKGCAGCHAFSGAPAFTAVDAAPADSDNRTRLGLGA